MQKCTAPSKMEAADLHAPVNRLSLVRAMLVYGNFARQVEMKLDI